MNRIATLNCLALIFFTFLVQNSNGEDWLQWRGPDRMDRSGETGLLKSWPANGPGRLWVNDQGGLGYAGFSVRGNQLFTMGLAGGEEFALCLNTEDGSQIWRQTIGQKYENAWGDGPRSTPTIDGDRVYFMSARGTLACLDAESGSEKWSCNMSDFGGKIPQWGYAESPLVDGDRVICTPGGDQGAIIALNKMNGEMIWQTKSLDSVAHYSSVIAADWAGKRQYIQLLYNKVVGVDAENGDVLWESPWKGRVAVIPTPIFIDGTVYVTSGYRVGAKAIQLDENNKATEKWFNRDMQNHHGGVILVDGHIYGYSDSDGWCCQNLETGELAWKQPKDQVGKGAVTWADGRFYHIEEKTRGGSVILIEASPSGFQEKGRFQLSPLSERRSSRGMIWVHPVVANGKLYLRDQEFIHCFDISN